MRQTKHRARKIGIRFSDNDFTFTIRGFLDFLKAFSGDDTYHYKSVFILTKEQIAELFNRSASTMYIVYQNQFEYSNGQTWNKHIEHIHKYLQITSKEILIDDEVDEYKTNLLETRNANSEFHYGWYYEHGTDYVVGCEIETI